MQKLAEGVYGVDLCLYLPDIKTLIVSDLHIGYEGSMQRKGVLVPNLQFKETIKRLDWILDKVPVKKVLLNGDIKHEFGKILQQEWREVLKLFDYFKEKDIEVLAIKGNHDTILGPIAKKRNVKEVKEFKHKDVLVIHGDYVPEKLPPIILMGHEHPAISLREEAKLEKFKCFIKGKYKKSTLIVQPSFNTITTGTDVLEEHLLSPLLEDLSRFEVFVVNDKTHEILSFGKVKDLA